MARTDLKLTGRRRPVAISSAVHSDDKSAFSVQRLIAKHALNLRLDEVQNWLVTSAPTGQILDTLALEQQRHREVNQV